MSSIPNNDLDLFDVTEIENLDWSDMQTDAKDKLASEFLILRPLKRDDYDRGHTKLLEQLTKVGDVTKSQYEDRFNLMKESKLVKVVVIEDTKKNQLVGTATLLCEPKFIHECSWTGHIQEIVIDQSCRGKGLGKIIVNCLKLLASQVVGTYKVDLDCNDGNVGFYEGLGFQREAGRANYMVTRYKN